MSKYINNFVGACPLYTITNTMINHFFNFLWLPCLNVSPVHNLLGLLVRLNKGKHDQQRRLLHIVV